MLPDSKITIDKEGNSHIEGMEQSDQCYKLREMGERAGKVTKSEDKDHTPVYQDVHQRSE